MKDNLEPIINNVKSNARQLLETLIIIVLSTIPFFVDLSELFKDYLAKEQLSPENVIEYIAISKGKYIAAFILLLFSIYIIRKCNSQYSMNERRVYHEYPYIWYLYCAKILGIKKCSLVLVPIYMQFKLIIRGVFNSYPLDEKEYPVLENEPECSIQKINTDGSDKEINLILEDTYTIQYEQIPIEKTQYKTIKISRNNGNSNDRHYSQQFIEKTINEVRHISGNTIVNVFATTNPMNNIYLARQVFGLGNRGNILHLFVFQQSRNMGRKFEPKGHKIY